MKLNMERLRHSILFFGVALLYGATCAAQVIPHTVEPGRVEENLKRPPEPVKQSPEPSTRLPVEAPQAPSNADAITFTLQSLTIDGSSVFTQADLLGNYRALLGQSISLARVYGIAAELTRRYRSAGYILSSVIVPEQKIESGNVRLQAVEGYLASVEIEGDLDARGGLFARTKQKLLAERPLRNRTLERYVLLLNDLPGVTAQAILRPSPGAVGATDLIIRVARGHRVSVDLGVNNRGSKAQGPVQYDADVVLTSVLHLKEETSIEYLQANPRDELWLASINHKERLNSEGLDFTANASRSRSTPALGRSFLALNLETSTDQGSLAFEFPLKRSRAFNIRARSSLTYHDGMTDSSFGTLTHDKIAAVRIGLAVDTVDAWNGVNLLDLEMSKGLSGLGTSRIGDPLASRPGGDPQFSKATTYLARLQSIGPRWSVLLAASGQFAFTNVLAPEEFTFGGEFFGRAYDASEVVGDSGLAGKVEVRFTQDNPGRSGYTLYGFYEDGHVWRRLAPTEAGARKEDSAASAGGGLRLTLGVHVSAFVEGAVPLNHIVAAEGNRSARAFAGLKVDFGQ
jgi:hemolysin activation/secretion protein